MYIIKEKDFNTNAWSGGTTTELFIYPPEATYAKRDFGFRISSAVVEDKESLFTDFSGYMRRLMILEGEISLQIENKEVRMPPYKEVAFSGADKVRSFGECVDFNVIYRPEYKARVEYANEMWQIATNEWVIIYNLKGDIDVKVDEAIMKMKEKELLVIEKGSEKKDIQILGEKIAAIISIIG